MTRWLVVCLLIALARGAACEPPAATPPVPAPQPAPSPRTPEAVATQVLALFKAKDAPGLAAVAAQTEPDPWVVADFLLWVGEPDAAAAFATAAPRKDVDGLPAYVASRRGKDGAAGPREALRAGLAALAQKKYEVALEQLAKVVGDAATAGAPPGAAPAAGGAPAVAGDVPDVLVVEAHIGRGWALAGRARNDEASRAFLAAAERAEAMGWFARAASSFHQGGRCAYERGDFRTATAAWESRRRVEDKRGNASGVAKTVGNLGVLQYSMGAYARARELQEEALALKEALKDQAEIGATLGNLANVYAALGLSSQALATYERSLTIRQALGDRAGVARTLGNIGLVHYALGAYPKALECHTRALKLKEELEDAAGAAMTLGNIGIVAYAMGDLDEALAVQERALAIKETLGDRAGKAATLGAIGLVHQSAGRVDKALAFATEARALSEELGDRAGAARALGAMGLAQAALGQYEPARASLEGAIAAARDIGAREVEVRTSEGLAALHLEHGNPAEAVKTARRGIEALATLVSGLADEQGASARGQYRKLFDIGTQAAFVGRTPRDLAYFLESGRAGALLESLGGAQRLRSVAIPETLLAAEAEARARENAAVVRLKGALDRGDRPEIAQCREALEDATAGVKELAERIQREAKRGASLVYPVAAELERIQAGLAEHDALVLYGLLAKDGVALVATRKEARVVHLGDVDEIEAAARALLVDDEDGARPVLGAEPAARLRALVIEPLKLPADVRRLLVSPDGALSYVPFSLLVPDLDLAWEPSGSTLGVLEDEGAARGDGVLALGDPDYTAPIDAPTSAPASVPGGAAAETPAAAVSRGGRGRRNAGARLVPLPGTREEAKAVGDVVLLGREATEGGFRAAVAARKRWRAVHFACHGLVDPENPTLSSLAITPGGGDDGMFMAQDVLGMQIPSDLVVMSACETGKGKLVQGEGIVGLTRAFMFAGAPRVICSLWKVDDQATRALMVAFYERWKAGTPTAQALREAQAKVRDDPKEPKWKDPYYWAAWVLWGLPN